MSYLNILYSLYPQIVRTDGDIAYDINDNIVEYDKVAIQAQVDANAYKELRVKEYPSIGDQLDALFHAGVFPSDMADKIQAVKDKYPKV